MNIIVVNDAEQWFGGRRYRLCDRYFKCGRRYLHREVWKAHHGAIPPRAHIHHRDNDRRNNDIANLELHTPSSHLKLHGEEPRWKEHGRRIIKLAQAVAPEWHRSPAGREWHRNHYQRNRDAFHRSIVGSCEVCGTKYQRRNAGTNRFCSRACKAEARRRSGVDDVIVSCAECGMLFSINKNLKREFCGRRCSAIARWKQRSDIC